MGRNRHNFKLDIEIAPFNEVLTMVVAQMHQVVILPGFVLRQPFTLWKCQGNAMI